jgi:hypothetical protein
MNMAITHPIRLHVTTVAGETGMGGGARTVFALVFQKPLFRVFKSFLVEGGAIQ